MSFIENNSLTFVPSEIIFLKAFLETIYVSKLISASLDFKRLREDLTTLLSLSLYLSALK